MINILYSVNLQSASIGCFTKVASRITFFECFNIPLLNQNNLESKFPFFTNLKIPWLDFPQPVNSYDPGKGLNCDPSCLEEVPVKEVCETKDYTYFNLTILTSEIPEAIKISQSWLLF